MYNLAKRLVHSKKLTPKRQGFSFADSQPPLPQQSSMVFPQQHETAQVEEWKMCLVISFARKVFFPRKYGGKAMTTRKRFNE